jgi:glycosyltransferase involved in cell wall biosynthesis
LGQITGPDSSTDRKNTYDTVKWFLEAFANKPYGLVLKTNSGTNCKLDRHVTAKKLKTLINAIRPTNCKAKVYLLHGRMKQEEVAALYKHEKINALVSATRGEGFGLPLLEAAASGLPVIATNWSGHKDFLDLGEWTKIKKTLIEVPPQRIDGKIFVPGAKWAQPNRTDFVKKINYFIKNEEETRKKAQLLRDRVVEKFSFASIAKDYDRVLGNI